jgi:hypothetical protein
MARYFLLHPMGNDQDKSLAFLDVEPPELGEHGYRLAVGKTMQPFYPSSVRFQLQPESPGIRLEDLLGNLMGYLIVREGVKRTIEENVAADGVEFFPFVLVNHRRRVHATNYWIVNPIGSIDCVNRDGSEIVYSVSSPEIPLEIKKFLFDERRLDPSRHLFRVPDDPRQYFISEKLAALLQDRGVSNLFVEEIETR